MHGLSGRRPDNSLLCRVALELLAIALVAPDAAGQLTGELGAHDPSTVIHAGGTYYYYATGQNLESRTSTNLTAWNDGPAAFSSIPAWTTAAVPGFQGFFWAPDVIFRNNQYYLYYSVSTFGSKVSAIGVATSPTLNASAPNYGWTDQGMIIQSGNASNFNAIDPSILQDSTTGRLWMAYGSFNAGIFVTELNSTTGKRLAGSPAINVAAPGPTPEIEASALVQHDGFYYLFVNWGGCCSGVDSTYNIRVGRSVSPTGPFVDRNGVNLLTNGGTLFLDDDGRKIGPGHLSFFSEGGQDRFGYHYYDGNRNGAPTFGLKTLSWTADGWPSAAAVNPNWSGAVSADWSQTANWSTAVVPDGVGHVANFGSVPSGRYTVAVDGAGRTVGTLNFSGGNYLVGASLGLPITLDAATGDDATINVSAGSPAVATPLTALDQLGVNVTPPASVLSLTGGVAGSGLNKYGDGALALAGGNTFSGSIFVRNGTLEVVGTVTTGAFSSVGQILGETGVMTVRGTGRFTSGGDLNVADTGDAATAATGTLNIRDAASVVVNSTGGLYVGSGFFANTRAVGTVNQSGGTLTVSRPADGSFVIGGRTSALATGTYNLSGGTINANTNMQIGGRGTGNLTQTGGTLNSNSFVAVGRYAGAVGSWTVSSGVVNQTNAARMILVGEEGRGTLTVQGTGQVNASGTLRIGHAATGVGTVNLDGGVIAAPSVTRGAGSATFNFNGGVLRATGGSGAFFQGLTAAPIKAGGATIDSQSFLVTVAQALTHDSALGAVADGGLTKLGGGGLTLNGANSYTGPTTVAAGTLLVNGTHAGGGDYVVAAGATWGGNGTIDPASGRQAVVTGIVAPGSAAGVVGTLTFGATAGPNDFALDVGGAAALDLGPGGAADRLILFGALDLSQTGDQLRLNVLAGGLDGSTYTLATFGAGLLAGEFDEIYLNDMLLTGPDPLAASGYQLQYDHAGGELRLEPLAPFAPGDFDGDGLVDAVDLSIWETGFGGDQATREQGDADGNGKVDGADLMIWQQQLGASSPVRSATAAVPEPTTGAGLALALAGALLRRRRPFAESPPRRQR